LSCSLIINEVTLPVMVQVLCERDSDFAQVYETLGLPPMWSRPEGFATLIHIILERKKQ